MFFCSPKNFCLFGGCGVNLSKVNKVFGQLSFIARSGNISLSKVFSSVKEAETCIYCVISFFRATKSTSVVPTFPIFRFNRVCTSSYFCIKSVCIFCVFCIKSEYKTFSIERNLSILNVFYFSEPAFSQNLTLYSAFKRQNLADNILFLKNVYCFLNSDGDIPLHFLKSLENSYTLLYPSENAISVMLE